MQNFILAASLLLLVTPANSADIPDGSMAQGQAIIQRECATCHATGTQGTSPNPKSPPFREIAKRYPPDNLVEALAEGIVTGHNEMPEFMFEPDEIIAIVSYLETLK